MVNPAECQNSTEWFYEIEGERKGPVDGMAVSDLVESGVLGYGSRVWNREFGDWKPLEETRFRDLISAPPPLTGTAVNNTII